MKFGSWLKAWDMFSIQVQLNYSEKAPTFATKVGGFASILVRVLMLGYTFLIVKRMVTLEADELKTLEETDQNPSAVALNDLGFNLLMFVSNSSNGSKSYDSVKRFIRLTRRIQYRDWLDENPI